MVWGRYNLIRYICIMYVWYIIYTSYYTMFTNQNVHDFLSCFDFFPKHPFRQIGQNTRDPNSLFPLERSQPHRQFDVPNFPGSGCPGAAHRQASPRREAPTPRQNPGAVAWMASKTVGFSHGCFFFSGFSGVKFIFPYFCHPFFSGKTSNMLGKNIAVMVYALLPSRLSLC